jgi:hypothetical protein
MRFLILAMMLVGAGGAAAQTPPAASGNPQALDEVYRCAEIADDAQRLACYDSTVSRLQQAQSSGQVVAVDREQIQTIRRDSFGFSLSSLSALVPHFGGGQHPADEPIQHVELQLRSISALRDGRHRFIMANGQVWTEIEPQSAANLRPGDTVTVRAALAGSFLMTSSRGGAAHRVRREN